MFDSNRPRLFAWLSMTIGQTDRQTDRGPITRTAPCGGATYMSLVVSGVSQAGGLEGLDVPMDNGHMLMRCQCENNVLSWRTHRWLGPWSLRRMWTGGRTGLWSPVCLSVCCLCCRPLNVAAVTRRGGEIDSVLRPCSSANSDSTLTIWQLDDDHAVAGHAHPLILSLTVLRVQHQLSGTHCLLLLVLLIIIFIHQIHGRQ